MNAARLMEEPVIAVWALLSNRPHPGPAYTLHRFSAGGAQSVVINLEAREQAREHVPPTALQVRPARGDQPALVETWVEVALPMRELLLTDAAFCLGPATD